MSSGSYFTIYKKCKNDILDNVKLEALKNEYYASNKREFSSSRNEHDLPILMHSGFKAENISFDENIDIYYSQDGTKHVKLLDFHFGSSYSVLKDHFKLNAYVYSESSKLISKDEAAKMLQAIEYILNEEYNKKFEDVLNNEYVNVFGNGYSSFDNRFMKEKDNIYVDRKTNGYEISFGDSRWDSEIAEYDNEIRFNLKRTRSCLQAFLDAECYEWNDFDLVLEYSAY